MAALTRRRLTREHMDRPDVDRRQQADALRFIRLVNERLGGTSAALGHFKRWSRHWPADRTMRILDLGTGSADIPRAIADWAEQHKRRVHITAVDLHPLTLELARQHIGDRNDIELVQADARSLMDRYEPAAFDYAHAGMFLHHLPDIEILTTLRIMDRLTTRGIIWNDLVRGPIERLVVRLMTIGAPEHVRHDARVSVDAGFTRSEALDLARRVGLEQPSWHRHLFGRFTLTSEKRVAHAA